MARTTRTRSKRAANRRGLIAVGLVLALLGWYVATRPPWESWSRDPFWQLDRAFADPGAIATGDAVHVYTTSARQCFPSECPVYWVPRFASDSLDEPGSLQGDAMPTVPAWVAADQRSIWAPSVARIGDAYVMYFAATSARSPYRGMKCLGVAVASSPAGPFAPLPDPLQCTYGFWNLDPYPVSDGRGWFLLWREDDPANATGKIVGAQLRADGLAFAGAPTRTLLVGEFDWEEGYPEGSQPSQPDAAGTDRRLPADALVNPSGIGPIENPAMARHPETREWLLTWSANRWETRDYATGLAICEGPLGPCARVSRERPWLRSSSDPSISTSATFGGCGGLSFVTGPDGRLYAIFHAYRGSGDEVDSPRVGWVYAVDHIGGRYRLIEFG